MVCWACGVVEAAEEHGDEGGRDANDLANVGVGPAHPRRGRSTCRRLSRPPASPYRACQPMSLSRVLAPHESRADTGWRSCQRAHSP